MINFKSKRRLAAAAAVLSVVGGGGVALAASSESSPSPSTFFEAVAKHLGVSTEKLQDATKAAALDQVDAALDAGTITKEQADQLKSRIEASEWPLLGGFGLFGGFRGWHHDGIAVKFPAAADYLGLTAAELREELAAGKSLADVAEARGKSVDGLKQAIVAEAREQLDQAVQNGKLTDDQAKKMLEDIESRIDEIVNGTFSGPRGGKLVRPDFSGPPPAVGPVFGAA